MPTSLYLVWLLWIVNQHTFFGCQQIGGTEDIRNIKIQENFEPSLWSWPGKQQSDFYTKHSRLWWSTIQLNLVAERSAVRLNRNSHIWSNEPSLRPWTWRQETSLPAWHFGPWCCITIPSLVTEGLAAEGISSRWTVTKILNLFCDLDLDHYKAIQSFSQDNPPYDDVPSNQVWLPKDQQFR